MKFTVVPEPEPQAGGYSVHVPVLPGRHSQGDSREEALANIKEAIELYIDYLRDRGEPIPREEVETVEVAA